MKRGRLTRCLAGLLACVLLSGCAPKSSTTFQIFDLPPEPSEQMMDENYTGADYFAPGSESTYVDTQVYNDVIIPAPGTVAGGFGEPDGFDMSESYNEQAYNVNDMIHGDLTYGVVVTSDALINPLQCTNRDLYAVNQLVFESLIDLDEEMRPVPLLADTWEHSGNVWTFTLREGVRFHDGRNLTAGDVDSSYREILRNPGTIWYELAQQIEDMAVVDDRTLRVRSAGAGTMVLYAMTFPVVQQQSIQSTMPQGTGPYWYIRYIEGTSLRLERNPIWWKVPSDQFQSIVVILYKSIRSALFGLEAGEIDAIATDYPVAAINRTLSDRLTVDYSIQTYECIVPNLRHGILSDLAVRQALMYAIDRVTLGNTVYTGMVQECEVPVIPGSWLYDAQATKYNYSPERALQVLHNAGWEDSDYDGILEKEIDGQVRNLSLKLITADRGTTATRSEAAELIAQQLRVIGVDVTVEVGTASALKSALDNGKFELALCGFEMSTMPNLAFLFASQARNSSNYSRYVNNQMDAYLREAYNANDEAMEELLSAMSSVQMQVVEDLPILGLFFRSGVLISKKPLGGLTGTRQYDVLRGIAGVHIEPPI